MDAEAGGGRRTAPSPGTHHPRLLNGRSARSTAVLSTGARGTRMSFTPAQAVPDLPLDPGCESRLRCGSAPRPVVVPKESHLERADVGSPGLTAMTALMVLFVIRYRVAAS